MFMVLKIIAFEFVVGGSLNYEKNTCDGPSTCQKSVLRIQIRLRGVIHNSISLILMER